MRLIDQMRRVLAEIDLLILKFQTAASGKDEQHVAVSDDAVILLDPRILLHPNRLETLAGLLLLLSRAILGQLMPLL